MYRKNLARVFALSSLVALAACGGDAPQTDLDEPNEVVPETGAGVRNPNAPVEPSPSVMEGATMMDTTGVGAALTGGDTAR